MTDEYLFSYGTLQKESVQQALFGRVVSGKKDRLRGYVIASIEITDPDFLARGEEKLQRTLIQSNSEDDFVDGTVLQVRAAELLVVDQYEPANYSRVKVGLASGDEAWLYVAAVKIER